MAANEEGPRAFSVFLSSVADGELHQELSEELHALVGTMQDEALNRNGKVKGTMTIKLKFQADQAGIMVVEHDVATKKPTRVRRSGLMFITKGGNLSVENERQTKLDLRDVTPKKQQIREIGKDD